VKLHIYILVILKLNSNLKLIVTFCSWPLHDHSKSWLYIIQLYLIGYIRHFYLAFLFKVVKGQAQGQAQA